MPKTKKELDKIVGELEQARASISAFSAPDQSGVYVFFLKPSSSFEGIQINDNRVLYIGSASSLAKRDIGNHLNSKGTGFSTLRRSLGAILKQKLRLTAIPRSAGTSETNTRNYRFASDGEDRLTNWMRENLEISVYITGVDCESIERQLIHQLKPVLNLKGWDNPYQKNIKALRKICAAEAKQNRAAV